MKNRTPLNNWVLDKILCYLIKKEGFLTEESLFTEKGMSATIRDVFGYRYEVSVKTLGRTYDDRTDEKASKLDFTKINGFSEYFYE